MDEDDDDTVRIYFSFGCARLFLKDKRIYASVQFYIRFHFDVSLAAFILIRQNSRKRVAPE